jgi:hypothetical protein
MVSFSSKNEGTSQEEQKKIGSMNLLICIPGLEGSDTRSQSADLYSRGSDTNLLISIQIC